MTTEFRVGLLERFDALSAQNQDFWFNERGRFIEVRLQFGNKLQSRLVLLDSGILVGLEVGILIQLA